MGITIEHVIALIAILFSPILLCFVVITAYIIIDKWVDIVFYPFEILRDKIDKYKRRD